MHEAGRCPRARGKGHDVFSVYDDGLGVADTEVIRWANEEGGILITYDKDFSGKVH